MYEDQSFFLQQLTTTATNPDQLLKAWVNRAIAEEFIKGTKDPKEALHDITNRGDKSRNKDLEPLDGVFNVWRISFMMGEGLYTYSSFESYVYDATLDKLYHEREHIYCQLNFIKTSPDVAAPLENPAKLLETTIVRKAAAQYQAYAERFSALKAGNEVSKAAHQERKKVEKLLNYWGAKRKFYQSGYNRDANAEEEYIYTSIFKYEYYNDTGVITYQSWPITGSDVRYVFHKLVDRMLYDQWEPQEGGTQKGQILNDQDRLLLMQKASQDIYTPVPIVGCKNVWGTCFTLSEGKADIIIIKTAPK